MAEDKEASEIKNAQRSPSFVEVLCRSSGKTRRFAAETEAGFAVNLINKKVLNGGSSGGNENIPLASHIEAVKEGEEEEPISFGPKSVLVDYGPGWKLQTVTEKNDDVTGIHFRPARAQKESAKCVDDSPSINRPSQTVFSCLYIGKILLAFLLIFVFGAILTLFLENLPPLILYLNSSSVS